jgi:anti-sigma factor RsiW
MNHDAELKLQAWLDGELSEREAAEVADWLARDREAQLLLAELQNTDAAMAGQEEGIKLPESREFFWSKISREIERQERAKAHADAGRPWLLRLLVPVGSLAAVAFLAVWLAGQSPSGEPGMTSEMELASDDMGAYTFRDHAAAPGEGLTMIWFYDRKDDSQFTPGATFASLNP